MQSPDDLPPFADQFRPRWPGDVGGFTAEQMRAYRAEGVAQERERCAKVCEDRVKYWPRDDARIYEDECCAAAIRAGHTTS